MTRGRSKNKEEVVSTVDAVVTPQTDNQEIITAEDRIPSNWSINNLSYEIYEFRNTANGKVFVGKVQDFNAKYLKV
jgi:hypothetical protein